MRSHLLSGTLARNQEPEGVVGQDRFPVPKDGTVTNTPVLEGDVATVLDPKGALEANGTPFTVVDGSVLDTRGALMKWEPLLKVSLLKSGSCLL